MVTRGDVYFPDKNLPPGQDIPHRCVVLSPTNLIHTQPNTVGNRFFATVAIIRSATHQNGTRVRPVFGHSIPISEQDFPGIKHDSLIETHQLFAVELDVLNKKTPLGKIPKHVLDDVLAGVRRLFT